MNRFRILEIVKSVDGGIQITALFKFSTLIFFEENPLGGLLEKLREELKGEKKKKITVFATDLTFLLFVLLDNKKIVKNYFNLNFMGIKGEVHKISLEWGKREIIILDTLKFIPDVEGCKMYYSRSAHIREKTELRYTERSSKSQEFMDLNRSLLPIWVDESNSVSSFYEWELTAEKLTFEYNSEDEMRARIKENFLTINDKLKNLDNCLKNIIPQWEKRALSAAGISKEIFETAFNKYGIEICLKTKLDKEIRQAFFGGRCEVFGNPYKGENVYHFDFKNMFGLSMLENFPIGEPLWGRETEIKKPGFYWVKIKANYRNIPILPCRVKNTNSGGEEILYPWGEFKGVYSKEELQLFLDQGGGEIVKIYKSLTFEKEAPVFREFATTCAQLRELSESNKTIWKQILVSLYGRLAMNPLNTKTILIEKDRYEKLKGVFEIMEEVWLGDNCIAEIEEGEKEDTNSNVIYAALITAKARVRLYKTLIKLEESGGRLLYCDTDSYFVTFEKSPLGKKIGEAYFDPFCPKTVIRDAVFSSIRNYSILRKNGWETRISGIRRNSINFDEFKKTFYSKWTRAYMVKNLEKKSIFNYKIWEKEKHVFFKDYSKRTFLEDKKTTTPRHTLNNERSSNR